MRRNSEVNGMITLIQTSFYLNELRIIMTVTLDKKMQRTRLRFVKVLLLSAVFCPTAATLLIFTGSLEKSMSDSNIGQKTLKKSARTHLLECQHHFLSKYKERKRILTRENIIQAKPCSE